MVKATNLGFPRIGARRELKKVTEDFWSGAISEQELHSRARELRLRHWTLQKEAGLDHIPSNDFSFYDQVLDVTALVGAIPARYGWKGGKVDSATYFAMARGSDKVPAMEMTKWFDTNYHYIVPEFTERQEFRLSTDKPVAEFTEAKNAGILTRPVLPGPVTYLLLGKPKGSEFSTLTLLDRLLPVYEEVLKQLEQAGAKWVQLDEPCMALDQPEETRKALQQAYARLAKASGLKILVATYFEGLRDNLDCVLGLPVAAVHLDLVRYPQQLDAALAKAPKSLILSLGVIDGRNIWRANLTERLSLVEKAVAAIGGERVFVAPSCSLLHTPVDLEQEDALDDELKSWMAFSKQKVREVVDLAAGAGKGRSAIAAALADSDKAADARRKSRRIHNDYVKQRCKVADETMLRRHHPYAERALRQRESLQLPQFPTTTIGSFPQTPEVRKVRAEFKRGDRDAKSYEAFMREEIERVVKFQEEIGIDMLVHGEPERNDMVEYFGEMLQGYTFTKHGWVQSYGSRYVKPPVIFGDVSRPEPMTVKWSKYAQSLSKKPMKGMLTGPVTMLQWSFVRDDQPRSETARQIAFALRDEVLDLEAAGIKAIQIDEPAIREGLPLRKSDWGSYLRWAVDAFRLCAAGVRDETQIHTHMCYSEFNDIIESIAELDADVISIETSRSQMELLDAFANFKYPNEIGPGVYDIHSPRQPTQGEMEELLRKAVAVLRPEQIWVNPDCGLKTRKWDEVKTALRNMVGAARQMRKTALAA